CPPRRGSLRCAAAVNGGKNALRVDADVAFADATTGTSQVAAVGVVGFGNGAMPADDPHLRLHPVPVERAKALAGNGLQLPVSGVVTGTATVSGGTRNRPARHVESAHH